MHDEAIILEVASEIHAHAWIRVAEIPASFGTVDGHHYSELMLCPSCGRAWGRRRRHTSKPHAWAASSALCLGCGGSTLVRSADYQIVTPADAEGLTIATMEYLLDAYRTDPAILNPWR